MPRAIILDDGQSVRNLGRRSELSKRIGRSRVIAIKGAIMARVREGELGLTGTGGVAVDRRSRVVGGWLR